LYTDDIMPFRSNPGKIKLRPAISRLKTIVAMAAAVLHLRMIQDWRAVRLRAAFIAGTIIMASHSARGQAGEDMLAAARAGDRSAVARLIAAKSPLDAPNAQGATALLIAVQQNKIDIAKALIAAGASINAQAVNKDTPWLLAGALGRTEIIKAMIPAGPDFSIRNRYGGNALIPACERGHVEAIEVLLATKIDVNHVNNLGWTCLLEIVILGDGGERHRQAAKLVLAAGADPNLADKDGVTPLAHARKNGQAEVAELIAAAGGT
jgi:uncharacterized protein